MAGKPFNSFSYNSAACMNEVQSILKTLVEKYAGLFVDIFKKNIEEGTSLGPGKPQWRQELTKHIQEQAFNISSSIIEAEIGFPENLYSMSYGLFMKAMLVMYGSGIHGLYPKRITAGPPGRLVWDSDLNYQVPSLQDAHDLPLTWNHIGNDALNETLKDMAKYFDDLLNEAYRSIDASLFRRYVSVSK